MDRESPCGLCDYVSHSPFKGKLRKNEAALAWGVTEQLRKKYEVEQAEHSYTSSRKRCDRVVALPRGGTVWLEMKHAWRRWYYEGVQDNKPFFYNGYFRGDHHTHSVAHDFEKLELLRPSQATYVALLMVGFDGADAVMERDMQALSTSAKLQERGWRVAARAWPTKESSECWHRCWFWWRSATTAH
jgi:hypothetical protein